MAGERAAGERFAGRRFTLFGERRSGRRRMLRNVFLALSGCTLLCAFWFAFFKESPTSFVARVQTTVVRFTTATTEAGEDGTGLFAPSKGPFDMAVHGCIALDPLSEQAAESVSCKGRDLQLAGVRLSSLVLDPQTTVTLTMFDGGVRMLLQLPANRSDFHCVVSSGPRSRVLGPSAGTEAGDGPALPRGEWLLRPGQNGSLLSMAEADGVAALPDEKDISLSEGSDLYLEQREASALTGKENVVEVPLADEKKIALDASRLRLLHIHGGSLRRLQWERAASGPSSMSLVVSGKSNAIEVFGGYSDEATNYAVTYFDNLNKGRNTQSLIAAATTLALLASVLSGAATCGLWWNDRQKLHQEPKHSDRQERV